ncbi:MAG: Rid family hydrolase [Bacteroidales bacterium]|nr:Rid family hydrolase [Bacteroidales bacterium]
MKNLSAYLANNVLQVLIGFGFGFEYSIINQLSNDPPGIVFLRHTDSSGWHIQLVCTDSRDVKSIRNKYSAGIVTVSHYDSLLYFISNIHPDQLSDCYSQAYSSFKLLGKILKDYTVSYSNLARTWLYLNDILSWYGDLNRARNDFFVEDKILEGLIPASTGIGLDNIEGKCLLISAFALTATDGKERVRMIDSPMQGDAVKYKSLFSRAVEITFKTSKRLVISGTASIDEEGNTLHKNSVVDQIEHSMKVVEAILLKEQYHWDNIVRAIAYFRDTQHIKHFRDYCMSGGIDTSCVLTVGGTVCRDDLLFEIELDAVKPL